MVNKNYICKRYINSINLPADEKEALEINMCIYVTNHKFLCIHLSFVIKTRSNASIFTDEENRRYWYVKYLIIIFLQTCGISHEYNLSGFYKGVGRLQTIFLLHPKTIQKQSSDLEFELWLQRLNLSLIE